LGGVADRLQPREASRRVVLAAVIAVLPASMLAIASIWWMVATPAGGGLWPPREVSLVEAAATRDLADVERLIGFGADPNVAMLVRPGFLANVSVRATPLEAAVWSRDLEMMTLLLDEGAIATGPQLQSLRCLNDTHHDADIRAVLERLGPGPWPACDTAAPSQ
jgi:hypothetical protein